MISSISNSKNIKKSYRAFLKWSIISFLSLGFVIVIFLVVIDPLDNIPFSPDFKRAPIAFNQRFSYPALARKQYFDSLIIGTSASGQLNPKSFNALFRKRFVNLSMNAATPYEQFIMTSLFFKHHPKAEIFAFGIDARFIVWCNSKSSEKYTFRQFPVWMYDENPWNDLLYLFNGLNIEIAFNQALYLMGYKIPTYDINGYNDLMRGETYLLERVREHIYGQKTPKIKPVALQTPALTKEQRDKIVFPEIGYMKNLLDIVPEHTIKIIFYNPQHWFAQPVVNSAEDITLRACKEKIHNIIHSYKNVYLLDYMKQSDFTTQDENYIDDIHITKEAADKFVNQLYVDLYSN